MRDVLKSMLSTVIVVAVIVVAMLLIKLLAMIPFRMLFDVFLDNWVGLIGGIVLSHIGMFFSTMGQRRRRRKNADADEEI